MLLSYQRNRWSVTFDFYSGKGNTNIFVGHHEDVKMFSVAQIDFHKTTDTRDTMSRERVCHWFPDS